MLSVRSVVKQIERSTPEQREAAFLAVLSAIVIGAFPLLVTTLILMFVHRITLGAVGAVFFDGEVLILTNAIVATAAMLIGKRRRSAQNFPGGPFFILAGALLLALSTACFVCVRMVDIVDYKDVAWYALDAATVVVFALGAVYAYFLFLLDIVITPIGIDPEKEFDNSEAAIEAKRAKRKGEQPQEASQEPA